MSRMNNIDEKFRDKLKGFQKIPPSDLWEGIESSLQQGKKRRLVPVFWKYAAGIIILLGIGTSWLFLNRLEDPSVRLLTQSEEKVDANRKAVPESEVKDEISSAENENIPEKTKIENNLPARESGYINKTKDNEIILAISGKVPEVNSEDEQRPAIGNLSSSEEVAEVTEIRTLPLQIEPFTPPSHPIDNKTEKKVYSWDDLGPDLAEALTDSEKKKFTLAAIVSPVYSYRDLGNISASVNESFNQAETGKVNMGGGLNFGFAASKRLSIHSGIMYSRIGIGINDIQVVAEYRQPEVLYNMRNASNSYLVSNSIGSIESGSNNRAKFDQSLSNADSPSREMITDNYLNPEGFYAPSDNYVPSEGSIDQYFQYLEVPLLFKYTLIDRQIDFNLLGGLSTNFLIGNKVLYNQDGVSEIIGSTSNVRTVNYSGNFGLGVDYNLADRFHLLFEPRLKYYLNSINTNNLIENRPYTIGFYSGFIYLF
jgi:hypothetical protein